MGEMTTFSHDEKLIIFLWRETLREKRTAVDLMNRAELAVALNDPLRKDQEVIAKRLCGFNWVKIGRRTGATLTNALIVKLVNEKGDMR